MSGVALAYLGDDLGGGNSPFAFVVDPLRPGDRSLQVNAAPGMSRVPEMLFANQAGGIVLEQTLHCVRIGLDQLGDELRVGPLADRLDGRGEWEDDLEQKMLAL